MSIAGFEKSGRSMTRDYQLRHRAMGLCKHCSSRMFKSGLCQKHYLKNLVYERERQRRNLRCKIRYSGAKSYQAKL